MVHTGTVRKSGSVAAGAVVYVLVVIWIGYHQSEPDFATIPTGPTTKVVVIEGHKTCDSVNPDDVQEHRGHWWAHGLVTVDTSPIGVTALWLPGLNAQACEDQLTHYGRRVATALADGIRGSPRFPSGTYNCPADDGSEVILFFHYSDGGVPEVVTHHSADVKASTRREWVHE